MDILHLSDDELDFEIMLRKQDPSSCRTRREKTGKLRAIIEVERSTMEVPDTADHVINQAEHIDYCQKQLRNINNRLTKALEQESSTELAICRSKLLHYRGRVAMISDKDLEVYVRKLESYTDEALQRITHFFNSVTLLSPPPTTKAPGDVPILPEVEELANKLQQSNLQSSLNDLRQKTAHKSLFGNSPGGEHLQLPRIPRESSRHDQQIFGGQTPAFPRMNPSPVLRHQTGAQAQQPANHEPIDVRDEVIRYLLQGRGEPARNSVNNMPQRFRSTQPIHKWPFSYAGEANIMQLAVFLNRVKTYADTEEVDEISLLRGVKHLLRGRALEWYIRSYHNWPTWEHFKKDIKKEFLPLAYSQHMKRDLYWRLQGPEESFLAYYRDILALFEVVEPPLSDHDRFYIMKSNLNPEFAAIASASRAGSVDELIGVCKDYDEARRYSHRSRSSQIQKPFNTPQGTNNAPQRVMRPATAGYSWNRPPPARQQHVNALEGEEVDFPEHAEQTVSALQPENLDNEVSAGSESATQEINALRSNIWQPRPTAQSTRPAQPPSITCWQCEQHGHTFPNCQNPKTYIFCYYCGKKGTISRNCPDCITRLAQAVPEATTAPGNARPGFLQ